MNSYSYLNLQPKNLEKMAWEIFFLKKFVFFLIAKFTINSLNFFIILPEYFRETKIGKM